MSPSPTPTVKGYSSLQVHDIIQHSGVSPEAVVKVLEARTHVMATPTIPFTGTGDNGLDTPMFSLNGDDAQPKKKRGRRKKKAKS